MKTRARLTVSERPPLEDMRRGLDTHVIRSTQSSMAEPVGEWIRRWRALQRE